MTVTILDADKRIGTHVFATVARNDAGPALDRGHNGHSPIPLLWNLSVYLGILQGRF